ncbi:hypothetical protein SAMN05421780_110190 [Flexibacter flexilis DSM 6793]|uniref:Uncharacterized protein n=1 Tax=Flexibacter flexilis DSM 6793 TaxID=927664 RepID=A0A1I1MNC5_9BACT|nr:hypothetical protein [Flexibacter flexilis]SFC84698.1 hypothetical protein SAMN05421780_110190 [Flexibacter flexilis DSM 6793]
MKKLLFIALFYSFSSYAQELEESKIDEFTGTVVKRTTWEKISSRFTAKTFFRISRLDTLYMLDWKYSSDYIFGVAEGSKLMLKLENDSIYTLINVSPSVASRGGGRPDFWRGSVGLSDDYGISTSYVSINDPTLAILKKHKVVKFRFYTTKGYIEEDVMEDSTHRIGRGVKIVHLKD